MIKDILSYGIGTLIAFGIIATYSRSGFLALIATTLTMILA